MNRTLKIEITKRYLLYIINTGCHVSWMMLPGKGSGFSVSSTVLGLQTGNKCRASGIGAGANSQSHGSQLCSSSQLHGHAGSLKSTRVGAFTPQNSANTTHQHYFSQKVGCAVCTSTPPLQAEDNRALHAEQWTGQQGLCTLSEGSTQILENKSLPCKLGIINSFIFT